MAEKWEAEYRNDLAAIRRQEGVTATTLVRWGFWLLFAAGAIGAVGWGIQILSRPAQVISRVTNPDRVIADYEWFRQQYQDIQKVTPQLTSARFAVSQYQQDAGPRKNWDYQTTAEYNRLNAIVLGLQQQRANLIGDYNARASMISRNLWMGQTLPSHIEQE